MSQLRIHDPPPNLRLPAEIVDLHLDPAHVGNLLGHNHPSTYTHLFRHANHSDKIRDRMQQGQILAKTTTRADSATSGRPNRPLLAAALRQYSPRDARQPWAVRLASFDPGIAPANV